MRNHFFAFWNLENLFAPEGYINREIWLAKTLSQDLNGWTEKLFMRKLDQLILIIKKMNELKGPDLLGVCEVENRYVLEELCKKLNQQISNRDYKIIHADSTKDHRGIDTAFIYDGNEYSVESETIFSHFVMRRTGTRDITQATLKTSQGNEIVVLCNHWPSRSGGAYESRGFRMTAGETLAYWHQRIWEEKGNEIPIIAMGDFNDDPFDESIVFHARGTRERGDVERAQTAAQFYNLAWNYMKQVSKDHNGNPRTINGSLYFDGNGNLFDQLLVSKGLLSDNSPIIILEDTAKMELFPEMVDHRVSYGPIRFGLPKGNPDKNINKDGFSDHFPVSVVLSEK